VDTDKMVNCVVILRNTSVSQTHSQSVQRLVERENGRLVRGKQYEIKWRF